MHPQFVLNICVYASRCALYKLTHCVGKLSIGNILSGRVLWIVTA
jgi:hypothetical protein